MRKPDNTISHQKLSQLLDGEWFDLDPSVCVATLCADDALRAKWSRYHIIRDVIKGESVQPDRSLADRICAAVQDEPTYTNVTELNHVRSAPVAAVTTSLATIEPEVVSTGTTSAVAQRSARSWLSTGLAGSALAASVALVTVISLEHINQPDEGVSEAAIIASGEVPQPVAPSNTTLPDVEFVSNKGSYWVSTDSSTRASGEEQLNMMLSHHLESSPTAGREGLLSYSRLVGYEEKPL